MPIDAFTRVVMKPGASRTSTVSFPIAAATAAMVSSVSSLDSSARTISMSFILWTGLKKCMPPTRDGCDSAPAISVMLSADVLVATTACGGANCSMSASSFNLRSMRSGAASMMKSDAGERLADVGRRGQSHDAGPGVFRADLAALDAGGEDAR